MQSFKPNMGSGNNGYTTIFSARVPKTDLRIVLNAFIDEIQAILAVARSKKKNEKIKKIQQDLIMFSAFIAGYRKKNEIDKLYADLKKEIEKQSSKYNLKEFIIFGDDQESALLNLARVKIRLAELLAWKAKNKTAAIYLNGLSDYIFLLSIERYTKDNKVENRK